MITIPTLRENICLGLSETPNPQKDKSFIYASDQTEGNTCIHVKTEAGQVIKLYQQDDIDDADSETTVDTINAILAVLRNNGLIG